MAEKRKAGRPKGSKSTKPRKTTEQYRAEREPKRVPWRPSAYTEDLCDKLREFFYKPLETVDLCGNQVIDWPTLGTFARAYNVNYANIDYWRTEHEDFRRAVEECLDHVKTLRIQAAESRIIDPNFEKFVLSAGYQMREESAVTIGQDQEKPFQVKIEIV